MVTPLLYESKAALAYIASNILLKRDDIVVHLKNVQLLVHPYHQSYLFFSNTSAVAQGDHLHTTPHWCGISGKGPSTELINEYTFQKVDILFLWILFCLSLHFLL